MTLKSHAKFKEKLTFGLKNDMRNLANFHGSTQKFQNWDFYSILLSKRKCMILKFTGQLYVMRTKNDAKLEKELTCQSKTE